jgi:hypothetical protein
LHQSKFSDKIEPAASHGISNPSGEAGFPQALALALLSIIMYKRTWIETIINEMNTVSTCYLRKEFREVTSKLPSRWTRSYFASTAGNVSKETIQRYLEAQKG